MNHLTSDIQGIFCVLALPAPMLNHADTPRGSIDQDKVGVATWNTVIYECNAHGETNAQLAFSEWGNAALELVVQHKVQSEAILAIIATRLRSFKKKMKHPRRRLGHCQYSGEGATQRRGCKDATWQKHYVLHA